MMMATMPAKIGAATLVPPTMVMSPELASRKPLVQLLTWLLTQSEVSLVQIA